MWEHNEVLRRFGIYGKIKIRRQLLKIKDSKKKWKFLETVNIPQEIENVGSFKSLIAISWQKQTFWKDNKLGKSIF